MIDSPGGGAYCTTQNDVLPELLCASVHVSPPSKLPSVVENLTEPVGISTGLAPVASPTCAVQVDGFEPSTLIVHVTSTADLRLPAVSFSFFSFSSFSVF